MMVNPIQHRGKLVSIEKILALAFMMLVMGIHQVGAQPAQLSLNLKSSTNSTTINTHFTLTGTSTPPINGSIRLLVGQADTMMFDSTLNIELKNGVWTKELWLNQTGDWTFKIIYYGTSDYHGASSNIVTVGITNASTPINPNPGTSTGSTTNNPTQTTTTGGVPGYANEAIFTGVVVAVAIIAKKRLPN
jgi:hypothetical protein